jgi:hypothetical protein
MFTKCEMIPCLTNFININVYKICGAQGIVLCQALNKMFAAAAAAAGMGMREKPLVIE